MSYTKKFLLVVTVGACTAAMPVNLDPLDKYDLLWQSIDFDGHPASRAMTSYGAGYQLTSGKIQPYEFGDTTGSGYAMVALVNHALPVRKADTPAELAGVDVVSGEILSGDVGELRRGGGTGLIIGSVPGLTAAEPHLTHAVFQAVHHGPIPAMLIITIDSSISSPGGIATVSLRNWASGEWTQVAQYAGTTSVESNTIEGIDAAQYVNEQDGRIELSIRHLLLTGFEQGGFESRYERITIQQ